MLNSKLARILYLLLGVICLALAKGDWPMVLPGFLFPYFLLRYTRSKPGITGILWLFLGIYAAVFFGIWKRMSFFPLPFYLFSTTINALHVMLPLLLERVLFNRIKGFVRTLIYPLLITGWEFILAITSNGTWSTLGYSQIDNPLLMQAASLFGLFFITFLTAYLGSFLNWLQDCNWNWRKVRLPVLLTLSMGALLLMYGNIQLRNSSLKETTRLAGIISKEEQREVDFTRQDYPYWQSRLSPLNLIEKGLSNTEKAIASGAKIVVWAEAYLFIDEQKQADLLESLRTIASKNRVYILASYLMLKDENRPGRLMENKAVMIDPFGKVRFHYLKSYLVNGIENLIIDPGTKEIPVIDTEFGRIGTVICYDMMFPQFTRQAGRKRIDLLLVPGYDWQGVTPLATQVSSVPALENRTSFLRVTTDGLSAAYDNKGRYLGQMNAFTSGEAIFICDIPIENGFSFYTAAGWVFPYIALGLICFLFGWHIIRQIVLGMTHLFQKRAGANKKEG